MSFQWPSQSGAFNLNWFARLCLHVLHVANVAQNILFRYLDFEFYDADVIDKRHKNIGLYEAIFFLSYC